MPFGLGILTARELTRWQAGLSECHLCLKKVGGRTHQIHEAPLKPGFQLIAEKGRLSRALKKTFSESDTTQNQTQCRGHYYLTPEYPLLSHPPWSPCLELHIPTPGPVSAANPTNRLDPVLELANFYSQGEAGKQEMGAVGSPYGSREGYHPMLSLHRHRQAGPGVPQIPRKPDVKDTQPTLTSLSVAAAVA